jgi:hypothetical protein
LKTIRDRRKIYNEWITKIIKGNIERKVRSGESKTLSMKQIIKNTQENPLIKNLK